MTRRGPEPRRGVDSRPLKANRFAATDLSIIQNIDLIWTHGEGETRIIILCGKIETAAVSELVRRGYLAELPDGKFGFTAATPGYVRKLEMKRWWLFGQSMKFTPSPSPDAP